MSIRSGFYIAFLALTSATAVAADLPVKPAAPKQAEAQPESRNWSGAYIGIGGSVANASQTWSDNAAFFTETSGTLKPNGAVGGLYAGYRWQLTSAFVAGIEASWSLSSVKGSATLSGYTDQLKVKSLWTATGQLGFVPFDAHLVYLKSGLASIRTNARSDATGGGGGSNEQSNLGWIVAAGIERAVSSNVIIGLEYSHVSAGYKAFEAAWSTGGSPWIVTSPSRFKLNQFSARVSYAF